MSEKNDGGTAFPMQDSHVIHVYAAGASAGIADPEERDTAYRRARAEAICGLSKREWLAGKAMQGMVSNPGCIGHPKVDLVREAFEFADSMLAEGANPAASTEADDALDAMRAYFPKAETLHDCYRGIEALEKQRDQLLAALEVAREALDSTKGDINPERGYADELEAEVSSALDTVTTAIAEVKVVAQ